MRAARGVTVVMISHDIASAVRYGTQVLHLRNEPLFYGTAESYRASELCRSFAGGDEHV